MHLLVVKGILVIVTVRVFGQETRDEDRYHPNLRQGSIRNIHEIPSSFWIYNAQQSLRNRLEKAKNKNTNVAKNIIMFLGDGMSIQTLAAARAFLGQRNGKTGEEEQLSFEKFPYVGLVKTYCVNQQTPDSACTATAYLCGVKNNYGTTGVSAAIQRGDCHLQANAEYHTPSIANWALEAGKDAGIVTTTRITHASPSGTYAHTANRNWENDALIKEAGHDPEVCPDIALQLVHDFPGNQFKVILGGGRRNFLEREERDEEGTSGRREDGRDLREEWQILKNAINATNSYVWNREQLLNVDTENTDYLLGLFEPNHLMFNMLTNPVTEPTLEELTETALKMLQKSENGYFLFVEGGRIDHAHHDTQVQMALDETVEFNKAIEKALDMTSENDTLIVVTSDHSHVMAFNGYSARGKDVLGPSDDLGDDGVPYMTLSYTNGPGFRHHAEPGIREDVSILEYMNPQFMYPAEVPLESETHGAEDVAVFARGPFEHIFSGLYEQSEIPHLMAYAACIGPSAAECASELIDSEPETDTASFINANILIIITALLLQMLSI